MRFWKRVVGGLGVLFLLYLVILVTNSDVLSGGQTSYTYGNGRGGFKPRGVKSKGPGWESGGTGWPEDWAGFAAVNPDARLPNRGRSGGAE